MHTAEILRKINNLISIGTVTESKSEQGLSLARVKILERVTDFLPVAQSANSFKSKTSPVRVGEQVLVFSPYGEGDSGIIFGAIFNKGQKEPVGYSDTKEITEYSDGTKISYDTATSTMSVDAVGPITIICASATVQADTVDITATTSNTGDLTVTGAVTINGDLSVSGTISDVKGDVTNHVHPGVTPGTGSTGVRS